MTKLKLTMISAVTLGLAASFNGCTCNAEANMGNATPATPSASAAPPAPPPPAPPPPAASATPAPPAAPPLLATPGKLQVTGTQVKIPGELEFDTDKATIKDTAGSKQILTTLADFMKQNPKVTSLRIEGHTDNTGTADHNMKLSQERADAVKKWLTEHGIEGTRLATQGFGQTHPVAENDTADHKALNRRTEFHIATFEGKAANSDTPPDATGSAAATTSTTATPAPATPAKGAKKDDKKLTK